jgi:hypothetical protein
MTDNADPVRGETPRPWFVVGRPWNDYGPALIYSGSEDPHVGNMVADGAGKIVPFVELRAVIQLIHDKQGSPEEER